LSIKPDLGIQGWNGGFESNVKKPWTHCHICGHEACMITWSQAKRRQSYED